MSNDPETQHLLKIVADLLVLHFSYAPDDAKSAVAAFETYEGLPVDDDWFHYVGAWQSALAVHYIVTLDRGHANLSEYFKANENTPAARMAHQYWRDNYFN
ncbi:MAG: hypothetical protein GC159_08585 [Phycisphaera sp.]|nr:hypothetical protein [Phycisphaera sp.]